MRSALMAFYGAKIEATRRSLPAREIGAAIQAIIAEQRAAMRALADRQQAAMQAGREKGQNERHAVREATRRASADARPRDGPG
jgi:hypothetical protein